MRETRTLYRATNDGDGLWQWTCWAADQEDAEAYRDNPGFGGSELVSREVEVEPELVLDIRDSGLLGLAEAILEDLAGDEPMDAQDLAEEWVESGWRYPWEHDFRVADAMVARWEWIRYTDDYPEDAETWCALRDLED